MDSMLEPGIFRHPRPKRSILPPPRKKRNPEHKLDEISFDSSARENYLTGFHKRKVQRAKVAQAEALKKARDEKIEMRKQLREERKQELEEHVIAINTLLQHEKEEEEEDSQGWNGIQDDPPTQLIDHEEEYLDDDKSTSVIVEAVTVSKGGLKRTMEPDVKVEKAAIDGLDSAEHGDGRHKWPKKPRRKAFRYESRVERTSKRAKQKAGKKVRAVSRRNKD